MNHFGIERLCAPTLSRHCRRDTAAQLLVARCWLGLSLSQAGCTDMSPRRQRGPAISCLGHSATSWEPPCPHSQDSSGLCAVSSCSLGHWRLLLAFLFEGGSLLPASAVIVLDVFKPQTTQAPAVNIWCVSSVPFLFKECV